MNGHEADGITGGTPETGSGNLRVASTIRPVLGEFAPLDGSIMICVGFTSRSSQATPTTCVGKQPMLWLQMPRPGRVFPLICLLRCRVFRIVGIGMAIRLTIAWAASDTKLSIRGLLPLGSEIGTLTRVTLLTFLT